MDHGASTLRIPPNRSASGRDFVAGDVHGCFRTLEHALAKVHFDPSCDRLFSVGDLINRGPHSMEAVDWLTNGRIHAAVLGNHESTMLEHLRRGQDSVYEEWQRWIPDEELPRWTAALECRSRSRSKRNGETSGSFTQDLFQEAGPRRWQGSRGRTSG